MLSTPPSHPTLLRISLHPVTCHFMSSSCHYLHEHCHPFLLSSHGYSLRCSLSPQEDVAEKGKPQLTGPPTSPFLLRALRVLNVQTIPVPSSVVRGLTHLLSQLSTAVTNTIDKHLKEKTFASTHDPASMGAGPCSTRAR